MLIKQIISAISIFILVLPENSYSAKPIKVGFWNVENLFDLEDDPTINDDEYALGGRKNVTKEIYNLKLKQLSEVLDKMQADVLGLCEVENRSVLEELNQVTKTNYSIVHYDSPDNRGIDVALLYDASKLTVMYSKPITVTLPNGYPTRDILYVQGEMENNEIHLFINHWPSKYGGAKKTIPLRAAAGKTLRKQIEKILLKTSNAEIIVMGDLNDEPNDPSVNMHLGATMDLKEVGHQDKILWNVMEPLHRNKKGSTYKYNGKDMVYDHLIVSLGLTDNFGLSLVENSVNIFDGEKYRQTGGKYDGYPFRFWAGKRLLGGYSDHMPVFLLVQPK